MLCKYPVRIIFLDDDKKFLAKLKSSISDRYPLAEYYTDVEEFILKVRAIDYKLITNYLHVVDEEKPEQRLFAIDISNFSNEANTRLEQKQIGVIVVDHNLPVSNGVSILETFKDKTCFKILLTAVADSSTAIKAFNEDIIDGFISKTSFSMLKELNDLIEFGVGQYFIKQSELIIEMIKQDKSRKTALGNEAYQQLIKEIIERFRINEYYLLDAFGSYLLLDKQGKSYLLLISDTSSIQAQLDIANEYNFSKGLKDSISKGEKMIYWPLNKPNIEIEKCVFDTKPLHNSGFVYTILDYNPFSNNV